MSYQLISLFLSIAESSQHEIEKQSIRVENIESQDKISCCSQSEIQQNLSDNIEERSGFRNIKDQIQQEFDMANQIQQKQNIIKNIIKGFQNYFRKINNEEAFQRFSDILGSQKNISNIKKNFFRVMKKKNDRWNYILKRIISSKNLSKIFCSYLENEARLWLSTSRTNDIFSHQAMIKLLKEALQHGVQIDIKTYKKK
ncbi:hypothetical protein ABPG74_000614 [Tetrahymena malaccensis]